ncbi:MAG TPA: hypothetical protein VIJ14_03820 [Rhabdochlamydiaceae bacterium]
MVYESKEEVVPVAPVEAPAEPVAPVEAPVEPVKVEETVADTTETNG